MRLASAAFVLCALLLPYATARPVSKNENYDAARVDPMLTTSSFSVLFRASDTKRSGQADKRYASGRSLESAHRGPSSSRISGIKNLRKSKLGRTLTGSRLSIKSLVLNGTDTDAAFHMSKVANRKLHSWGVSRRNLRSGYDEESDEDAQEDEEEEGVDSEVGVDSELRVDSEVRVESDEGDLPETNNSDLDKLHEPEDEPEVRASRSGTSSQPNVPRIPTTLGKAAEADGEFRGIHGGVVDNTNITHLSYMIFKLIKKHAITSVVDMPCRNNLAWFPALLHRLDFEIVGFKYYCVDSDSNSQDDIRHLFGDAGSPEFMSIKPEAVMQLPKTDLLFSWNGPQQWGVQQTWAFFNGVREVRPEYLMITNNPGVNNVNSNRGTINVRKQPFHVSCYTRSFLRSIGIQLFACVPDVLLFFLSVIVPTGQTSHFQHARGRRHAKAAVDVRDGRHPSRILNAKMLMYKWNCTLTDNLFVNVISRDGV
jgi:hypothetical protein